MLVLGVLVATSGAGAAAWLSMWYYPGRTAAEAAAPVLHQLLPRGRTSSGPASPTPPYRRPQERSLHDAGGNPAENLSELTAAIALDLPGRAAGLLAWHLAATAIILTLYLEFGRPEHVRLAVRADRRRLALSAAPRALLMSGSLAALLPALGQFCWLTWWKFDQFDKFGPFQSPATFAAINGQPVAMGPFGVGGIWAGVLLAHALIVGRTVRSSISRMLRLSGATANTCHRCGYPRQEALDRCSECGEPKAKGAPPSISLVRAAAHPSDQRFRVALGLAGATAVLLLLCWPLVAAWPGRILPDRWVDLLPY